MLDHEPDHTDQPVSAEAGPTTAGADTPAPSAPRRRRTASRPAGPPSTSPHAPPIEHGEMGTPAAPAGPEAPTTPAASVAEDAAAAPAESGAGTAPPAKKTARKAPAKRAVKKTAETVDGEPKPARTRTRAAKKTVAAPPAERPAPESPAAEAVVPDPEAGQTEDPEPEVSEAEAPQPEVSEAEAAGVAADETAPRPENEPEPEPGNEPEVQRVDGADETATTGVTADADAGADPDRAADAADAADSDDTDSDDSDDGQDAEDAQDAQAAGDSDESSSDGDGRRRRRRRGGRRRRRTGGDEDQADAEQDRAGAQDDSGEEGASGRGETQPAESGQAGEQAADDEASEGDGSRRRRRRRRRRGEDSGAAADDPGEVVVRVREPRRSSKASSEVTGIDGSTRMEAKRQRRREGREAGRRRSPILSEAEFLARRESVARTMIIRQREDLSQIAVLEDGVLVEHYVDRDSAASLIGNVYLGRVQNVLPSMEAAFIDIGRGRNAVLYAGEVDWDSFGAEGQNRKVEKVLKSGQPILVQVSKDPVGGKGARLTNHVSIPGRYIVYAPGGHLSGISRKLPENERKRLKDILSDLVGESASVIVRTAAEGASEDELVRDVNRLKAQWEDIERKVAAGHGPQLLYGEPDLTVRIVRDLFTEDFSELIIQGNGGLTDAYESVQAYVGHVAPHLAERIRRWDPSEGHDDLFAEYRLDEQIAKGLERKVFLPSGGSLIIDRTEAMTVIDVNTGKFTGTGGNLEATVTRNNLEAAEEIVRQLRLRDIGGIIVIDFIDMVLPANRELLLRRLVECLGRDRTRHQVAEITSLGLVQMTRKKIGTGLLEAFSTECPHCHGRGVELHDVPVESQRQPDGGARESRQPSRRSSGGGGGRSQNPGPTPPADGGEESSESRSPRSRSRGGRGRRDSGQGHAAESAAQESGEPSAPADQPTEARESQPEPAGVA